MPGVNEIESLGSISSKVQEVLSRKGVTPPDPCIVNKSPAMGTTQSAVNHPAHYGGKDNPYEAIKVIEAWGLGFHVGNVVKYLSRAGKKDSRIQDLEKAKWYLDRIIDKIKKEEGL